MAQPPQAANTQDRDGKKVPSPYMAANTGAVCMSWVSGHSVEPNSTGKVREAQGDSTQASPRPKPTVH